MFFDEYGTDGWLVLFMLQHRLVWIADAWLDDERREWIDVERDAWVLSGWWWLLLLLFRLPRLMLLEPFITLFIVDFTLKYNILCVFSINFRTNVS